ncbi:MAG: beta-propeller fold lactonase family protein [Steroidobacteraceae bacterium]
MKTIHRNFVIGVIVTGAALQAPELALAQQFVRSEEAAVFVMTNSAESNEVIAFQRTEYGTLLNPTHVRTGGRGSGGTVDPLSSQGSLTLSGDRAWLFAANAGSGTVSVFHVDGSRLELSDQLPTEGSEPNAVAEHAGLVYVLNTAGSSSVVGFQMQGGKLHRIPGSLRLLSENGANSASVAFSPDGHFLAVTEKATNLIDVFRVLADGTLSSIKSSQSAGPGAFAVGFAPNGTAIVSETGSSAPNSSAISSYSVNPDGSLTPISISVPTLGNANCWNVVTPNGRFVYASNAGSSTIAGFAISTAGTLTALPGTVVGANPTGSSNIDITVSADGRFLYSLNAATGAIGMFAIQPGGTLTNLGTTGGLPASAGLNGIAAD